MSETVPPLRDYAAFAREQCPVVAIVRCLDCDFPVGNDQAKAREHGREKKHLVWIECVPEKAE